jgi:Rps23 Pro-64 3,4-dihydroxylase Tpa1-like proline 4-hydroxylase
MEQRIVSALASAGALSKAPPLDLDNEELWEGGDEPADEEEIVEVDEATVLSALDSAELPLDTCRRLFHAEQPQSLAALPFAAIESLRHSGYALLPSFAPPDAVAAARAEALALLAHSPSPLQPAASRSHAIFTDASARGDLTAFLHPASPPLSTAPALSSLVALLGAVRDDLATCLALAADEAELQLAVYLPGAAYCRHRDSFPDDGASAQRRVTAVLYANPGWDCEVQHGELRLHVPQAPSADAADEESAAAWVDVCPSGGTLVLFLSGAVDHAVLSCAGTEPRVALTAWCG